ncbi:MULTISPECIES: hypothetical protein [unclassified Streptomyces]|jgi:hypothetical protein|uniref:hypothetical protein n=1 Tax=unclassified Streptomyces TaxID=2593676 RepID=UPI000F511C74|nr:MULTISPECIES: hypothetical protein [unclassified Streptomyces]MDH6449535.1 hypothetical protein [Streptomyces sp. SAI-119]MDH6499883.1 hypothetical protein [Streptomyces sp. SAI-149]
MLLCGRGFRDGHVAGWCSAHRGGRRASGAADRVPIIGVAIGVSTIATLAKALDLGDTTVHHAGFPLVVGLLVGCRPT